MELDLPTRIKIANDFGIQKKNSTHVSDNVVVSDGYLIKDVEEALNIDALKKYLNTDETDMALLWGMLVYPVIEEQEVSKPLIPVVEEGTPIEIKKLPVTEPTDETKTTSTK